MKWQEVQERFPDEWIVFEAVKAHSEDGHRCVDELIVIDRYNDSLDAMRRYKELHRDNPQKEYYFLHTSRRELRFQEIWAGVKGLR
ncbi:hypothetical protein [Effusibacillus lacus]|uniref:Uncharacterized protein n=1 Tax=Effusibacillus lacus TaxID=1348429 RepID=A0A292YNR4_9BACL|nr:hypothetical protein [Effusibacillus lacus]GAX90014.1 hypothetical protein EFBL_1640 [Effusibacillus lacus]